MNGAIEKYKDTIRFVSPKKNRLKKIVSSIITDQKKTSSFGFSLAIRRVQDSKKTKKVSDKIRRLRKIIFLLYRRDLLKRTDKSETQRWIPPRSRSSSPSRATSVPGNRRCSSSTDSWRKFSFIRNRSISGPTSTDRTCSKNFMKIPKDGLSR